MAGKDAAEPNVPQSMDAEMSVLGAILIDQDVAGLVFELLDAEYFYSQAHQEIYRCMVELFEENRAIDAVTVAEKLRDKNLLDKVGGVDYLAALMDRVPSSANVEYYAGIVRERAMRRNLINALTQIQQEAQEKSTDTPELLDKAERLIFEISSRGMTQSPKELREILHRTMEQIDAYSQRRGVLRGISTGFDKLDEMTSGLQNSEFIILAARPGVGKTALSLNIAEHVALREQLPVAIFSLEMSADELGERLLCSKARVDSHKLRSGFAAADDWTRINLAFGDLCEARIIIDDTPGLTPLELRAKARRLKSQHDIRLIIVDYLQLMETRRAENRQQEIAQISRSLKALARELDIPLLAVSQLNRAPVDRIDQRPRLSDLRESGALEQDADLVLLLHRKAYQRETEVSEPAPWEGNGVTGSTTETGADETDATLFIAKQRNGPTGPIKLRWIKEYVRFEKPTSQEEP